MATKESGTKMDTRRKLLGLYWKARRKAAPALVPAQSIYEDVLKEQVTPATVWLDLGCGHHLLPLWREEEERRLIGMCRTVVGVDCDMPSLAQHRSLTRLVCGDITRLPFADDSFDLVTANMVVEHLDNPAIQFREVRRILKPGGVFIFHTPNAHGYFSLMRRLVPNFINNRLVRLLDGRPAGDIFKVHYKANSGRAINELAGTVGYEVVKRRMVVSDAIFAIVPPLMVFELLWIRTLMTEPLKDWRTNIITVLRKPTENGATCATEDAINAESDKRQTPHAA